MKTENSEYALHYVAHARRDRRPVTWFDVAAAYDAGLTHAIAVTPAQRQKLIRYFRALRIINGERGRTK